MANSWKYYSTISLQNHKPNGKQALSITWSHYHGFESRIRQHLQQGRQSFAQSKEIKMFMKKGTICLEVWQVGTNVSLKYNAYIYRTNQKYYLNHNMSTVWKRITEFSRPDRRSYLIFMAVWMSCTWLNRTKHSARDMTSSGGEDEVLLDCNVIPCGMVKSYQRYGKANRLHHQTHRM